MENCVGIVMRKLHTRKQFLAVKDTSRKIGTMVNGKGLFISARPRHDNKKTTAIGFTITKKIGNAVKRNKLRRKLKAAMQLLKPTLPSNLSGNDIVIVAKKELPNFTFTQLLETLKTNFNNLARLCNHG